LSLLGRVSNAGGRAEQLQRPAARRFGVPFSRRPAILIAFLLDVWLGGFFAWCARARIATGGPWSQPSFTLVVLFIVIIAWPTTAYLYLAHPDWSWLYLVDAERVPRLFVVPMVALAAGAVAGGFYGGAVLLRRSRERRALPAALGGLQGAILLVAFLARGRLLSYGSYGDYHGGRALPLFDVKLGYVLIAVVVGTAAAAAFVALELWRDARRATAR
jgi:hypothetical protein